MAPSILLEQSGAHHAAEELVTKTKSLVEEHELDSVQQEIQSNNKFVLGPYRNPSLQVTPDHQLKSVDAPVHQPGPGEVLLHIKATGVCG